MKLRKLSINSKNELIDDGKIINLPSYQKKGVNGQLDYYVTDIFGVTRKLIKLEILQFRLFHLLYEKKKTTKNEKSEIISIEKQLSEMSIERKKTKNGQNQYFVMDSNAKIMYKICKDWSNGQPIGGGLYEFTISRKTEKYKIEGYKVIVEEKEKKLVNLTFKTICDNTGGQLINGVKNVISHNFEKKHILLELDLDFFLIVEENFENRFTLPKKYDLKKQKLICVIDYNGDYVLKPMFMKTALNDKF